MTRQARKPRTAREFGPVAAGGGACSPLTTIDAPLRFRDAPAPAVPPPAPMGRAKEAAVAAADRRDAAVDPGTADAVPNLSVVIPCYNEESILWTAVTELHAGLTELGRSFEILISENGSKDDTRAIAAKLSRNFNEVRALHSDEPNYGKALRRGIEAARGEFVICEEIDLCDLDFHRRALQVLDRGDVDMVIGSKAHPDASDERPLVRRAATRVINGMLRVMLGFRGTDTHGLKAFRRAALLETVQRCVVDKDLFASELVVRAQRYRLRVVEIPITIHEKRPPSIHLFKRVPNVLKNLVKLTYVVRIRNR